MATSTYTAIASITLGSSASSVTFSSIPQSYRDLVLICNTQSLQASQILMTVNEFEDNIAEVSMMADGSNTSSNGASDIFNFTLGPGFMPAEDAQFFATFTDYSQTDKYKSILSRLSSTSVVSSVCGTVPTTSGINTFQLQNQDSIFLAGSTFALYGIEA